MGEIEGNKANLGSHEEGSPSKDQNKTEDFSYLEPYERITRDTRYHNLDGVNAPRSSEQLIRERKREQTRFVIVMILLILLFALFFPALYYFGQWEPSSPTDEFLKTFIDLFLRVPILLIAVIVVFYFSIRWALHRIYVKRMIDEFDSESSATNKSKESNRNLCNSCMRLIDDSAKVCPYCGAAVDLKKHFKPEKEERATTQEIVGRLPDAILDEAKSYIPITFLVIVLIILFGLLFHGLFFPDGPIRLQLVLASGSVIVGMYCILGTTYLARVKMMSAPYLWQLTVPVGRKASFSELLLGQTRWLVMAIFCLAVFFFSLLIPF